MKYQHSMRHVRNSLGAVLAREPRNIIKSAYIWNFITSFSTALSSVLVISILSHFSSVDMAGMYSTAVAISNISYVLASFNIVNFQISDTQDAYKFGEYFSFRLLCTGFTILFILGYNASTNYTGVLSGIIVLQTLYRCTDSICEAFQSNYQKLNRLDIGCKLAFFRLLLPDGILVLCIVVGVPLFQALIAANIVKVLCVVFYNLLVHPIFSDFGLAFNRRLLSLLKEGFPLFISALLMSYIQSAPKLAIGSLLEPRDQTCFTAIFMPAMVIHLVTGIIYRPLLTPMAHAWHNKLYSQLKKQVLLIFGIVLALTVACVAGAYFLGVPVLNLIYGVDIAPYHTGLLLLLVAGGLNAFSVFLNYIITTIRLQNSFFIIYGLTAVLSLILMNPAINTYGIMGAAYVYLAAMALQLLLMVAVILVYYCTAKYRGVNKVEN